MHQDNLFGKAPELKLPSCNNDLTQRFVESKEIVQKAIVDLKPYAIGLMLSGGTDSITALQVAIMLGVPIDFIMHGVTGTGLKDCRKYVHQVAERTGIKLIEANAGNAFENYVKRKGFFGKGATAHKYSYHILKANPFAASTSKHFRKRIPNRKILLLNGVRIEESENRADNFGDITTRAQANSPQNIWVNIIHWWSKKECLQLLDSEGIKQSPVALALGRSGECNCGTMQNEADSIAAAEYDPDFKAWLWPIRKYCIEKFGWDIGQNPNPKRLQEIKKEASILSNDMPMCVSCKSLSLFKDYNP
jgi:3'-phosphoadenosine 5'-phosphosulfate sulfotransferase (PAPS reductase)/FAD synthetase